MAQIIEGEFTPVASADDVSDLLGDLNLPVVRVAPEPQALVLAKKQQRELARHNLAYAIVALMEQKVERMGQWLDDVGKVNPRDALELSQQLIEFTLPRLKAASLNVNADLTPKGKDPREMTTEELEAIARGDT